MPRLPKKRRERKHWVLSEEMREWFVENGWDVNDQFRIDKMMQMDDFFKRNPGAMAPFESHPKPTS